MCDNVIDGYKIDWVAFAEINTGYPHRAIYKDNGATVVRVERVCKFQCTNPECDNRPFEILQGQLDDADGFILCDICDEKCQDVTNCTCSETIELYPTEEPYCPVHGGFNPPE